MQALPNTKAFVNTVRLVRMKEKAVAAISVAVPKGLGVILYNACEVLSGYLKPSVAFRDLREDYRIRVPFNRFDGAVTWGEKLLYSREEKRDIEAFAHLLSDHFDEAYWVEVYDALVKALQGYLDFLNMTIEVHRLPSLAFSILFAHLSDLDAKNARFLTEVFRGELKRADANLGGSYAGAVETAMNSADQRPLTRYLHAVEKSHAKALRATAVLEAARKLQSTSKRA